MSNILFYGVSLAVISTIIEEVLANKSSDKKDLFYKKLRDIGIGVTTIYFIIKFLPTIIEKVKLGGFK